MKAILFIFLITLFTATTALHFAFNLAPLTHRCFYEVLNANQKYRFDVRPLVDNQTLGWYSVKIDFSVDMNQDLWQLYLKKEKIPLQTPLNIHKLAEHHTTYSFCIGNEDQQKDTKFEVNIASGIELMELHLLPENTDAENLAQGLKYLDAEKQNLIETLKYSNSIKTETALLSNTVSSSIWYGVIIFTIVALGVNVGVYWKANKALQSRKTI